MTWLEDKCRITDALLMMPEATILEIVRKIELMQEGRSSDGKLIIKIVAQNAAMYEALRRAEQTVRNLGAQLPPGDLRQIADNEAENLRHDLAQAEGKE